MNDLISRQDAIDSIAKLLAYHGSDGAWIDQKEALDVLKSLPSAQRTGKWIDDGQYDNFFPHHEWRCSECGEHVLEIGTPWYKYCPMCGARMVEDE